MDHPTGIDLSELPQELRELVSSVLNRGEQIVWLGQPAPNAFAKECRYIQFGGFSVSAFAVFWVCSAAHFEVPDFDDGFDFFPLFGIPFVLMGIGLMTAPYWGRRRALKTAYAITDQRAILFECKWTGMSIRSWKPDQLGSIERKQQPDGSGDLVFERLTGQREWNHKNLEVIEIGFKSVPNVKQVEELLVEMVESHKRL